MRHHHLFLSCLLLLLFATHTWANDAALFTVFPEGGAPACLDKPSEFVVLTDFRSWESNSKWHPEVDEATVFHASLRHQSAEEVSWEARIGKGGQLYSICGPFGEAMSPQLPDSRWMDETWQAVLLDESTLNRPDTEKTGSTFIHQSGLYLPKDRSPELTGPFYSPMLASNLDQDSRAYSVLSWGQVPTTPNIHPAGALIYTEYKDLGEGVIQATYVVHNFGTDHFDSNGMPWGGVRTSVFPEHVLSLPDGGYERHTPWSFNAPGSHTEVKDTGGWAASVQNAANEHAFALVLVFGKDKGLDHPVIASKDAVFQYGRNLYSSGDSRHGVRDYSVMCYTPRVVLHPGKSMFVRVYIVIGTLADTARKSKALVPFSDYGLLAFTEAATKLVPLIPDAASSSPTLTRTDDPALKPVAFAYAQPVEGSLPLFQMRDKASGKVYVSPDPYALCGKQPFKNPYPPEHPKYAEYANRLILLPFDGKTEWLGLLGFAMPQDHTGLAPDQYISLETLADQGLCSLPDGTPGEKLMLRIKPGK